MMPPLWADLRVRTRRVHLRLWLPLFLIWILLLPIFLLVLPFAIVGFIVMGVKPVPALGAIFRVMGSLSGTSIEVDRPKALVSLRIV
ncbi:MAG: hypothetical protein KIS96_06190 [Bauldia sp.]|nr:hypothetical protein [Bauldia sp.]